VRIVWSRDAIRDMRALRSFIAEHDPLAAAGTAAKILEAVEMLREFPGMGRAGRKPHTRELVVQGTPYVVPYMVGEGRIEIIAVIHGARKWPQ
jgi:toxin ParE1/3/4